MASDPLRQYRGTTCYHLCPLLPVIRLRGKGVHNGWEGGRRRKLVRGETSVIGSLCCAGALDEQVLSMTSDETSVA